MPQAASAPPTIGQSRYADLAASLLREQGVALIGVRDPDGYDRIAPGPDLEVYEGCKLLYIADRPRLSDTG